MPQTWQLELEAETGGLTFQNTSRKQREPTQKASSWWTLKTQLQWHTSFNRTHLLNLLILSNSSTSWWLRIHISESPEAILSQTSIGVELARKGSRLFSCVSVHTQVGCTHEYRGMNVGCAWRPEDNLKCRPQELGPLSLRWDLSLAWSSLIWQGWLAVEPQGSPVSVSLVLGLQVCATLPGIFEWVMGTEHNSLCLGGKCFTNWAIHQPILGVLSDAEARRSSALQLLSSVHWSPASPST